MYWPVIIITEGCGNIHILGDWSELECREGFLVFVKE